MTSRKASLLRYLANFNLIFSLWNLAFQAGFHYLCNLTLVGADISSGGKKFGCEQSWKIIELTVDDYAIVRGLCSDQFGSCREIINEYLVTGADPEGSRPKLLILRGNIFLDFFSLDENRSWSTDEKIQTNLNKLHPLVNRRMSQQFDFLCR